MKRSLARALSTICLLLPLTALPVLACGPGSSTITNLANAAGDGFQVAGLSSGGWITGYFYGTQNAHAFLYGAGTNGIAIDLGAFGADISEGFSVNASGQVAGGSYLGDFSFHGFIYDGQNLIDLGTLGGSFSSANVINDVGQIAGDSYTAGDAMQVAFLYTSGSMLGL